MIGDLSTIKHEKIIGPELTVGDILGYEDSPYERYFVVRAIDLNRRGSELRIQEIASSGRCALGSMYSDVFDYDLASTKRSFTRILSNVDKLLKTNLCVVVIAALYVTDELRNLLVELEI